MDVTEVPADQRQAMAQALTALDQGKEFGRYVILSPDDIIGAADEWAFLTNLDPKGRAVWRPAEQTWRGTVGMTVKQVAAEEDRNGGRSFALGWRRAAPRGDRGQVEEVKHLADDLHRAALSPAVTSQAGPPAQAQAETPGGNRIGADAAKLLADQLRRAASPAGNRDTAVVGHDPFNGLPLPPGKYTAADLAAICNVRPDEQIRMASAAGEFLCKTFQLSATSQRVRYWHGRLNHDIVCDADAVFDVIGSFSNANAAGEPPAEERTLAKELQAVAAWGRRRFKGLIERHEDPQFAPGEWGDICCASLDLMKLWTDIDNARDARRRAAEHAREAAREPRRGATAAEAEFGRFTWGELLQLSLKMRPKVVTVHLEGVGAAGITRLRREGESVIFTWRGNEYRADPDRLVSVLALDFAGREPRTA